MTFINKLAGFAAILGVLAIVLDFLDRVPRLLVWIYNWGNTTAWIIKIALVAGGGLIWFLTLRRGSSEITEDQTTGSEN